MADDTNRELTPEEKYKPKLPAQIQGQVDAVNEAIAQAQQPEEDQEEYEDDGQEEQDQGTAAPGQAAPQPAPLPVEESWEQRARSAHGRLEQTLQTNQQLARQIQDLQREMNLMKVRGAETPMPPVPKAPQKLIKPEELTDYGEEFFDVVGRRAKEEILPVVETFDERLKRLETGQQAVGQVVEQSQKRGLYDTLYDEVPEWKELNHHPAFINWLANPDPYSGRQRQEMLSEAFSRHDASRVVNFFRGFLTEATGSPPNNSGPQGQSAPPLPNGNGSGKPTLEQFAAPGRARSAPQQLPPDKPMYTHAWIAKFMADKRTGKFRGREPEADAIERDIFQAQHEGRIQ